MRIPSQTPTMNRKRLFAFLAMAPAAWSAGQCDTNGVCTVKGGLKDGKWWRKELDAKQPLCHKIDPDNAGTCHQWTTELGEEAFENVKAIKQTAADYIQTTAKVSQNRRILMWNDPMDELYLSAPKNTEGSDRVFVTPHIDGFVGWIPFMRAWRCVYGLTGPHDTVTILPMKNPDSRELTLGPGVFTCFDYNREIHWIENRPKGDTPNLERIVLKLHFYDYPALFGVLGEWFGKLNAEYNFFARRAFLVSQFPDRSLFSRLVARVINGITIFGGNAENVYGYCNIGIVLSILLATKGNLANTANWTGVLHKIACLFAVVFHSVTLGMLTRDVLALGTTAILFTGLAYLQACFKKFDLISFGMVNLGTFLYLSSFNALGTDRFIYGAQLAPETYADAPLFTEFPYDTMSHPFTVGAIMILFGLRIHPIFGPKFHKSFLAQLSLLMLLLFVEVYHIKLDDKMDYFNTFDEFAKFHKIPLNIYLHLLTTMIGIMGVLGLVNNLFNSTDKSSSSKTCPVWATIALTWLIVRFTVPDDDVAFITVPLFGMMAYLMNKTKPNSMICIVLLILGTGGQEFAHYYFKEETFMNNYAEVSTDALITFALHNVWLIPFEVRAAINAMTASLVPSFSSVYA
jgi:hypothetical protein